MAQTTQPVDIQILELVKGRLETIDGTTTNFYRTVDAVGVFDKLPEELWIKDENIERRWDYVIGITDVTESVELGDTGRYLARWTMAVSGFIRPGREHENPWSRSYDSDVKIRREIKSDIYVAMVTPDDQLGMLSRTPFPGDVDTIPLAFDTTSDRWIGCRTVWTIDYKFKRITPWTTA